MLGWIMSRRMAGRTRKSLQWLEACGVQTSALRLDPQHDRYYCSTEEEFKERGAEAGATFWSTPLIRGGAPYYPPGGWCRFALKTDSAAWQEWSIAYHGTIGSHVALIISTGFKATVCQHHAPYAYFSPSIVYASHPRYSRVMKHQFGNQRLWLQVVLEVRIRPGAVALVRGETLGAGKVVIDPNQCNTKLEMLVAPSRGNYIETDKVIATGIMFRALDRHPLQDPQFSWFTKWVPPEGPVNLEDRYFQAATKVVEER